MSFKSAPLRIAIAGPFFAAGLLAQSVIVVRVNESARITIDTDVQRFATAYTPVEIPVSPGKHLVTVISTEGSDSYEGVVEAASGKEFVLVDLSKIRAEKRTAEQSQKAQEDRQQSNTAAQQARSQCQQQLKQYQQQLDKLLNQYQAEMNEVQQANQLAQINNNTASQGGNVGSLAGLLRTVNNSMAQQHQQKANALQTQIQQVRNRTAAFGGCPGGADLN